MQQRRSEHGITLLEMLVVLAIVGLVAGLTFPNLSAGLDGMRLRSAADSVSNLLSAAMAQVERSQDVVEITVDRTMGVVSVRGAARRFFRELKLEPGLSIAAVRPALEDDVLGVQHYLLVPGATYPAILIDVVNQRGRHRIVRIDTLTSTAVVENEPSPAKEEPKNS